MSDTVETVACDNWTSVYEANAPRLLRIATVLIGEPDARDLVADAVARAVSSKAWNRVCAQGPYLTQVVVNLSLDYRAKRSRQRAAEHRTAFETALRQPVAFEASSDQSIVVRQAVERLSPRQLAVIHLHYWDELTLDEIAEHLGIHPGTVRRHLDRAKRTLKSALQTLSENQ